jgi:hypothetical protein
MELDYERVEEEEEVQEVFSLQFFTDPRHNFLFRWHKF